MSDNKQNADYKLKVSKSGKDLFFVKPSDEGVDVQIKGGVDSRLRLKSISYRKKIYTPCRVEFVLTISGKQTSAVLPSLSEIADYFKDSAVNLYSESGAAINELAVNFSVFETEPRYAKVSGKTSMEVRVVAFSPDFKLTFAKYCKCYTRKKFLSEVIAGGLSAFSLGDIIAKNDNKADISNLKFLTYKQADKTLEFIQPYLVQYNESFYDFIVRVASRCGEFLYYEKGKLNIGLLITRSDKAKIGVDGKEVKDKNGKTVTENVIDVKSLKSVENISYRRGNYSDSYGSTKDYRRDYVGSTTNNVSSSDKRVRDSELSQDDYMFPLTEDEYDDLAGELSILPHIATTVCSKFTSSSSLSGFVEDSAMAVTKTLMKAGIEKKVVNKQFKKDYFNNMGERGSGKEVMPFCSFQNKSDRTLFHDFYEQIRKGEENVSRKALVIRMDPDSYDPVFLGDIVRTDLTGDDTFIVVGIDAGKRYYVDEYPEEKVVINDSSVVIARSETSYWKREVVIEAVPFEESSPGSGRPYPPLSDVPPFRFAAPQAATVVGTDDPKRLGRVTVVYPWQSDADAENNASPYIRVSTDRAGEMGGTFYKMGKGEEVLVDYVNGNVERPFVIGQYYSKKYQPMFGTRKFATVIGSRNGHRIRVWDYDAPLYAISTFLPPLGLIAPATSSVTSNKGLRRMMGTMEIMDNIGLTSITLSPNERKILIESVFGDVQMDAFTGITLSAPNGNVSIIGKNVIFEAGDKIKIQAGKNVPFKAEGYIGKGNFKKVLGKALAGTVIKETLSFIDLRLYRCIYDTLVRPVDGTLRISSSRFVIFEAGEAIAEVDSGSFRKEEDRNKGSKIKALANSITSISGLVNALVRRYVLFVNGYIQQLTEVTVNELLVNLKVASKSDVIETLKQCVEVADNKFDFNEAVNEDIQAQVRDAVRAVSAYHSENKPSTYIDDILNHNSYIFEYKEVIKGYVKNNVNNYSFLKNVIDKGFLCLENLNENMFKMESLKLKRNMILRMLEEAESEKIINFKKEYVRNIRSNSNINITDAEWNRLIDNIDFEAEPGYGWKMLDVMKNSYAKSWGLLGKWDAEAVPKILFSDELGRTMEFHESSWNSRYSTYGKYAVRNLQEKAKDVK